MSKKRLTDEQEAQIIALLKAGKRIEAVQLCLSFTNAGLKVAKDLVDELQERISKGKSS